MGILPSFSSVCNNASPSDLPETVPNVPGNSARSSGSTELPKLPKTSTLERWEKKYDWLVITDRHTMVCKVCVSQKDNILLKNPKSPMAFINGSTNFKSSALNDHHISECHNTGIAEAKHSQAVAVGDSLPPKHVVIEVPLDSAIISGLQKMGDKERESGCKETDGHCILHCTERKTVH